MGYYLATYEILDGEHEHKGALILEAQTTDEAYRMADAEEFDPETDSEKFYFSYGGDGMTACRNQGCTEITEAEVKFLERVALAHRK